MHKSSSSPDRHSPSSHQLSRRSFIKFSLLTTVAAGNAIVFKLLDGTEFHDEIVPGKTIVGKDLHRIVQNGNGTEVIRVTVKSPLEWEVNGQVHSMAFLIIDGSFYPPEAGIPNTDFTIKGGAKDIVASLDNSGMDIQTSVGSIHISMEEFDKALLALAHPEPVEEPSNTTTTRVNIAVHIAPNAEGQAALNIVNSCGDLQNLAACVGLASPAEEVVLPDNVSIEFSSNTPPPLKELLPTESISDPVFSAEQIAELRQKRDDFYRLLSERILTSK